MILVLLLAIPAIAGLIAWNIRGLKVGLAILLITSAIHVGLSGTLWLLPGPHRFGSFLEVDPTGLLFLSLTSVIFLAASIYAVPYLLHGTYQNSSAPHRFVPCLIWFLGAMTLVTITENLALMWVAVETTTLASAPLIYFYRRPGSLEAAWKYLLICSVGIAIALLGVFFLGLAASAGPGQPAGLTVSGLSAAASGMPRQWLRAAFVLALVGYGTKMGLAPLHTWLPDAHSQAPSPVSALLSGALLNCAFLSLARFYQVCLASGDAAFARSLLLLLGFGSMAVAAVFMVGQRDYKRLLAYSSVENMGIVAIGIGVGGAATYGALFHAINHSLCKAGLFFVAGNILKEFATTDAGQTRGILRRVPVSGALLVLLLLAIGGFPPFGPFWSKLLIFKAMIDGPGLLFAALFMALLAVSFLGMAATLLRMLEGDGSSAPAPRREAKLSIGPPLFLAVTVLVLGIALPQSLGDVLRAAARLLGG